MSVAPSVQRSSYATQDEKRYSHHSTTRNGETVSESSFAAKGQFYKTGADGTTSSGYQFQQAISGGEEDDESTYKFNFPGPGAVPLPYANQRLQAGSASGSGSGRKRHKKKLQQSKNMSSAASASSEYNYYKGHQPSLAVKESDIILDSGTISDDASSRYTSLSRGDKGGNRKRQSHANSSIVSENYSMTSSSNVKSSGRGGSAGRALINVDLGRQDSFSPPHSSTMNNNKHGGSRSNLLAMGSDGNLSRSRDSLHTSVSGQHHHGHARGDRVYYETIPDNNFVLKKRGGVDENNSNVSKTYVEERVSSSHHHSQRHSHKPKHVSSLRVKPDTKPAYIQRIQEIQQRSKALQERYENRPRPGKEGKAIRVYLRAYLP